MTVAARARRVVVEGAFQHAPVTTLGVPVTTLAGRGKRRIDSFARRVAQPAA
jgi:hypothetical protein